MYGLFFGTLNGEVHQLQLPSNFDEDLPAHNTWHDAEDPADGSIVVGTFKSKEINFGDWDTIKRVRRVFCSLTGNNVTVTVHFIEQNGNRSSVEVLSSDSLPVALCGTPAVLVDPPKARSAQLEIEGESLNLTGIDMEWKQLRVG